MLKRIIPFMLFSICLFTLDLSAQFQFDRLYATNDTTQIINLKCIPTQSGGFAMVGVMATESDTAFTVNITNFDSKGNINWSMDYDLQTEGGANVSADLMQRDDGGFMLGVLGGDITVNQNKYLLSLSKAGDILWAKRFGGELSSETAAFGVYLEEISGGDIVYSANTSVDTILQEDIFVAMLDQEGTTKWSQIIDYKENSVDIPIELRHSVISSDTSFALVGLLDTIGFSPFLTTVDTSGNILSSYQFMDTTDLSSLNPFGLDIDDNGFGVISGVYSDLTTMKAEGALMVLNANGDPVWGRRLQLSPFGQTKLHDAKFKDNGNIIASGSYLDNQTNVDLILDFFLEFDSEGNLLNAIKNPNELRIKLDSLDYEIFPTEDGGAIFGSNSLNVFTDVSTPELMKLNAAGMYSCQDTIDFDFVESFLYKKDTLELITRAVMNEDTLSPTAEMISPFDVEELTLLSIAFCPNVPIDTILDATVEGGVDYIWNTGDTTAIIEVMAEGDYMVTVTVENENCYMLCDTGRITVYNEPELSLGLNFAQLCNDNSINIVAVPMAEAGVSSYMWSTGEDTPVINVSEPGSYTLTIIDNCDLSAAASIDISAEDFYMPGMIESVTVNSGTCFNGAQEIALVTSGDVETIAWNTGESNPTIFGFPNQSYSVTVTDACGATEEESVTVNPGTAQISLETQCTNDTLNLLVTGPQAFISATWTLPDASTVDGNRTDALEPGVYLINVIDACGNPGSAQYELSAGELFLCSGRFCEDDVPESGCLCFPRVFIPNSMIEENQSFGPANFCGGLATDYLLEVYNRWGKKVFESTTIGNDWGGLIDGELAPADVYIYYSEYSFDGQVFKRNGDVTLIR